MIKLLITTFLLCTTPELAEFLKSAEISPTQEAQEFLNSFHESSPAVEQKCSTRNLPQNIPSISQEKLFVFMSFSVPIESWKHYSEKLQKSQGAFVLKGLPNNSFDLLVQKLVSLREAGVNAPILLDPVAFETYKISSVPTILLEDHGRIDQIIGNIPLQIALEKFKDQGETKTLAKRLLQLVGGV